MPRRVSFVVTLLAVAGCQPCAPAPDVDDAGGDGVPSGFSLVGEELCVSLHRGFYRNLAIGAVGEGGCGSSSSEPLDLSPIDSEETTAQLRRTCAPGTVIRDGLEEALAGGRVRFSLEAIEACMASGRAVIDGSPITQANADARGDEILAAFAASRCDEAAVGLVGAGGECVQPWDCADRTLVCEPETPASPARHCRAPAAQGEPCHGSIGASLPLRSCAAGLFCDDGVCALRLDEGAPCGANGDCAQGLLCGYGDVCRPKSDAGGPCTPYAHSQCADGLFCRADETCGPPRALGDACGSVAEECADCGRCLSLDGGVLCRLEPALGEACEGAFDCTGDAWCDAQFPDPGVCRQLVGEGGDCSASIFACADDLDCVDGTCITLPGAGQPCASDRCGAGAYCLDDVCRAGGAGDPCTTDSQCDAGELVCLPRDDGAYACGLPRPSAGLCEDATHCAAGLFCDVDACAPLPGAGDACAASGACAAGAWCDDDDVCVPQAAPGEPCTRDAECTSRSCLAGEAVCTVPPVTCWGQLGLFETLLFFAVAVPLRLRTRRRRSRGDLQRPAADQSSSR